MLYALAEDGNGGNTGWLIAGKAAFKLDIATGKTTRAGTISGLKANARDIAVLAN
jgi:hypothetical protein